MFNDERTVATGKGNERIEGTYVLPTPESVKEMVEILSEGSEVATITVNVRALVRMFELALEQYRVIEDGKARRDLKEPSRKREKKLSAFGF